jgi:hypothetical protein
MSDIPTPNAAEADTAELVALGAIDSVVFNKAFFPKTFRQESPTFHNSIGEILDSTSRYINIQVFRDGAKTTLLRAYSAKRIAYGLSRTILYVGKSQGHASRSLKWLRKQIELNTYFTNTFKLSKGSKWNDEELEINHGIEGHSIWCVGMGITGSTRGLNFDDYRPDLIIIDDVVDEENSSTPEQREKSSNLVLGALKESLSPASESPFAKMVLLQTPMDEDDISQQALRDTQFTSARFGCWTEESENLPLELRESIWPSRYPTAVLKQEYHAAAARNKLSVFAREKEVKLVSPENSAFKPGWLHVFGVGTDIPEPPLHEMWTILVIDPVPPPSESELSKGLNKGDFEALSVVGRWRNQIYVLETVYSRGHNPGWTTTEFFRLASKWRIRKAIVESVAYQRTLAWLLREAMKRVGDYYVIEEYNDKRKKEQRIVDGLSGVASNHQLFFRADQIEAIQQFKSFSLLKKIKHDDVIETIAIGATALQNQGLNLTEAGDQMQEDGIEDLEFAGGCP